MAAIVSYAPHQATPEVSPSACLRVVAYSSSFFLFPQTFGQWYAQDVAMSGAQGAMAKNAGMFFGDLVSLVRLPMRALSCLVCQRSHLVAAAPSSSRYSFPLSPRLVQGPRARRLPTLPVLILRGPHPGHPLLLPLVLGRLQALAIQATKTPMLSFLAIFVLLHSGTVS